MKEIAFLGLGAMGRRMFRRLVAAGHHPIVWSRSGVPEELADLDLRVAATPREAASAADIVISCVTDDDASAAVWDAPERGALIGLRPNALAIESSTLTPARVTALAERVKAHGARFLDAPVLGSRPQADAGALVFLAGGAAEDVAGVRDVLLTMGGAVHHLGPTPAGAVMKLFVNSLMGAQVALFAELFGFAERAGLDPGATLDVVGTLSVTSPIARMMAGLMVAGDHAPRFTVDLVGKDLRYAAGAAAAVGARLPLTERAAALFGEASAAGMGADNLTSIARIFAP